MSASTRTLLAASSAPVSGASESQRQANGDKEKNLDKL